MTIKYFNLKEKYNWKIKCELKLQQQKYEKMVFYSLKT